MDYIGYKCPVCEKNFHADDDIVVCPVCGAPHHRSCYEELGHCKFVDKHSEDFDFTKEMSATEFGGTQNGANGDATICPKCKASNRKDAFFCDKCGSPLNSATYPTDFSQQGTNQNANQPQGQMPPNYFGANMADAMDPMGGVSPDTKFDKGVTGGELAKYVKNNSGYFMRVFEKIRAFGKSKFSFAAFLFSGGYLLYRKQYFWGTIITILVAAASIFSTFIAFSQHYSDIYNTIMSNAGIETLTSYSQYMEISKAAMELPVTDLIYYLSPTFLFVFRLIIMIICGIFGNRMYLSHCTNKICKIKNNSETSAQAETALQTKGGVNTILAVSLLIAYFIMSYLPMLFM